MNLMCHGIIILIKHDFMLGGECVNRREKYKAKLGELFDIPVNAFSGMTTVEIRGFYEVMIQGCTGIFAVIMRSFHISGQYRCLRKRPEAYGFRRGQNSYSRNR